MIGVALGGVVGLFFLPQQRILAHTRAQTAFAAIEYGHPNAKGSEVNTCNDAHKSKQ
jgi:hypothetical protein